MSEMFVDIPLSPSVRVCAVCGYVGALMDVHTQADSSPEGFRYICCTCLGHEKGSCWKKDRFPRRKKAKLNV